jgi:hypothetical protein
VQTAGVPPPAAPRFSTLRAALRGLVGLAALVLALAWVHRMVAVVGWDEVFGRLREANGWGVALAAGLLALQMVFWSWRLRVVVGRLVSAPGFGIAFLALEIGRASCSERVS